MEQREGKKEGWVRTSGRAHRLSEGRERWTVGRTADRASHCATELQTSAWKVAPHMCLLDSPQGLPCALAAGVRIIYLVTKP